MEGEEEFTIGVGDQIVLDVESLWCWHDAPIYQRRIWGRQSFRMFGPMMGGSARGEVHDVIQPPINSELPVMLHLKSPDGWEYAVELPHIAALKPVH